MAVLRGRHRYLPSGAMSLSVTQLTDSMAGLHRATVDLRSEAERLAESLRGRRHDLQASTGAPEVRARVPQAPERRPPQVTAEPRGAPANELLPQVVAAFVPIL